MILTITYEADQATELGFLLHKNPEVVFEKQLSFGMARVFYPELSDQRCTAALAIEVDPVALVRGQKGQRSSFALAQYVNDRPYAASSFLSVALGECFGTALSGRSKEKQELADRELPFEVEIHALPSRGGEKLLRMLFEPLAYQVECEGSQLDEKFPSWGDSPYWHLKLRGTQRLSQLLCHLYVLMPVLDNNKHYWVGDDEVQKLLRRGEGWLTDHPEKELITRRYLKHQSGLSRRALAALPDEFSDDQQEVVADAADDAQEADLEKPLSLNAQRLKIVQEQLEQAGVASVIDLGCGEGRLLKRLLKKRQFKRITGVEVSPGTLEKAADRLKFERMPELQRKRIELLQGSVTYRDKRLKDFDACVSVEVIEHLEPHNISFFTRNLLQFIRSPLTLVSTPNREYNQLFENMTEGALRHGDHRFEWTREEFRSWAETAADTYDYKVEFLPIGDEHPQLGAPTQMARFTLKE